ncbi:MAG: universal stress protein [Comamonas sp.]|nr:universal stress protein [Comamonas sp.]
MFKHILVPVDGSPTALHAVSKAAGIAKAFDGQVTAVYVLDPYPFTGVGADFAYGQAQYLSAATAEANKALEDVKQLLDEAGVTSNTLVGEGHAIHEGIVRVGENVGADLIVMGSHGRRGLEKLVLGSVAQRVLQTAHVPVLVVRSSS